MKLKVIEVNTTILCISIPMIQIYLFQGYSESDGHLIMQTLSLGSFGRQS